MLKQLLIICCLGAVGLTQEVTKTLVAESPFVAGTWDIIEVCPEGSWAGFVEVKYEAPGGLFADEVAITAIKLYCENENKTDTGSVVSWDGGRGTWWGLQSCPEDMLITGVRLKILGTSHATFRDDVAVQDIEFSCDYGSDILYGLPLDAPRDGIEEGEWSPYLECDIGSRICGIQTRYDLDTLGLGDETQLADVAFYCCSTNF